MKTKLSFLSLLFAIVAISTSLSCNKEKTCECTRVYNDPSYASYKTTHETTEDCSYWEDSITSGGLTSTNTCEEI